MTFTLTHIGFAALAVLTLVGACAAVTLRDISHALLALVVFFLGVAGLFFTLRAEFIGVVQILVYVGAVAVLIVFAIVLTRSREGAEGLDGTGSPPTSSARGRRAVGALAAAVTGAGLVTVVNRAEAPLAKVTATASAAAAPSGGVSELATSMLTTYALPFELASVLLTAALIGAAVIAMDEIRVRR